MKNNDIKREHVVNLVNKQILTVTAITKVEYLSPEAILIDGDMGKIGVKGLNLYVDNLNSETGIINIKGNIVSVSYFDKDTKNKFLKRIFG